MAGFIFATLLVTTSYANGTVHFLGALEHPAHKAAATKNTPMNDSFITHITC